MWARNDDPGSANAAVNVGRNGSGCVDSSVPFAANVRCAKPLRFRFAPCGWQKTRTSSQSMAISLPGMFIGTSTVGIAAEMHCSDMMPGCDATPDQRRRTRPSTCSGLMPIVA